MKSLITLILMFISFELLATGVESFKDAPDFSYTTQDLTHFQTSQSHLLSKLDSAFADRGMSKIFLPEGFEQAQTSLSTMTRIYSGDLGQTTTFVKTGVIPSREDMIGEAVKLPNGFLYHTKDDQGLVSALFVQTDQWENAREIFSMFENKKVTTINFSIPKNINF